MKEIEIKKVVKEVVKDVRCNICGQSMLGQDCGNTCGLSAGVFGNYDSTHLEDQAEYWFDICEKCLVEKIFPMFSIPVIQKEKPV